MISKNASSFKRLLSFTLALIMLVAAMPAYIFADTNIVEPSAIYATDGVGSQEDPFTDTSNKTNFPDHGVGGHVEMNKTSKWYETVGSDPKEINDYAKVSLKIDAEPIANGTDVLLILDRSGSMGIGPSTEFSMCVDSSHYEILTWTTSTAKFNVLYEGETGYTQLINQTITVKANAHIPHGTETNIAIKSVEITGFPQTYDGKNIISYKPSRSADVGRDIPWTFDEIGDAIYKETVGANKVAGHMNASLIQYLGGSPLGLCDLKNTVDSSGRYKFPSKSQYFYMGTKSNSLSDYLTVFNYDSGCTFRKDILIEASDTFIDDVFKEVNGGGIANDNRISLMSFSGPPNDGPDKDKNFVDMFEGGRFLGADEVSTAKDYVENLDFIGYTSYVQPLKAAEGIIKNTNGEKRPTMVVFISDGAPSTTSERPGDDGLVKDAVKVAIGSVHALLTDKTNKQKVNTAVYSIGIGLKSTVETNQIAAVALAPGDNINVQDDIAELDAAFEHISEQLISAGKEAVITDVISDNFTLVENDPNYPMTVTINGEEPANYDYDKIKVVTNAVGKTEVVWSLGNISREAELTFYIKRDATDEFGNPWIIGNEYKTNDSAEIDYKNINDDYCEQKVENPSLFYTEGSIRVLSYLTNGNGEAIGKNGSIIANDRASIEKDGFVLDSDYHTVSGERFLDNGDYTGSVVSPKSVYDLNITRKVKEGKDGFDNVISADGTNKDWDVNISKADDFYTILAGYTTKPNFIISNTYEGMAPTTPTVTTPNVGELITASPDLTGAHEGYQVKEIIVTIKWLDENGNLGASEGYTGLTTIIGNVVEGVMPLGEITISYTYETRKDLSYTVEYYREEWNNTTNGIDRVKVGADVVGTGELGEAIPANLELYDFTALGNEKIGVREGAIVISAKGEDNVAVVVYKLKTGVEYTIEHYLEGSLIPLVSETKTDGIVGQIIDPAIPTDGSGNSLIPAAYTVREVTPVPAIIELTGTVIKVIYSRATDVTYTVQYFKEELDGTLTPLLDEFGDLLIKEYIGIAGDPINPKLDLVDLTEDGYKRDAEIDGIIGAPGSSNEFEAIYKLREDVKYEVIYYDEDTGLEIDRQIKENGRVGDKIVDRFEDDFMDIDGYDKDVREILDENVLVTSDHDLDNLAKLEVTYKKKTNISYIVEFYKDSVDATNLIDTLDVYTGTFADSVDFLMAKDGWDVNLHKPASGYEDGTFRKADGTIAEDADKKMLSTTTTFYVVYEKKTGMDYVVKFYKGSVTKDNYTGKKNDQIGFGEIGDLIPIDIAGHVPKGYQPVGRVVNREEDPVISADELQNVIYFVYDKMRINIPYTIEYYQDDLTNLIGTFKGRGMLTELVTPELYGYAHEDGTRYFRPMGYDEGVEIDGRFRIRETAKKNVFQVLFTKSSIVPFKVEIWEEQSDGSHALVRRGDNFTAAYGTTLEQAKALESVKSFITANSPSAGWLYELEPEFDGFATITGDASLDVMKVIFKLKAINDQKVKYTLRFWKDAANVVGNELNDASGTHIYDGSGDVGSFMTYDGNIADRAPEGYAPTYEWIGQEVISANPSRNIVDIVFKVKQPAYTATITFYAGSEDSPAIGTYTVTGLPGTAIDWEANQPAIPNGYTAIGAIDNAPTVISNIPSLNRGTVVYQKARYGYSVEYYRGDTFVTTEVLDEYGTPFTAFYQASKSSLNIDVDKHLEPGYRSTNDVGGPSRISYNVADNVFTVKYAARTNIDYSITYFERHEDGTATRIPTTKAYPNPIYGYTGVMGKEVAINFDYYIDDPRFAGYVPEDDTIKLIINSADGANDVSIYLKADTKDYTVSYYKDNDDIANLLADETHSGTIGDEVTFADFKDNIEDILSTNALLAGYSLDGVTYKGLPYTIGPVNSDIKIIFTLGVAGFNITYKYVDPADGELKVLGTFADEGAVGSLLENRDDYDNMLNLYYDTAETPEEFYLAGKLEGDGKIQKNAVDNEFVVIYKGKNVGYTVEYYLNAAEWDETVDLVRPSFHTETDIAGYATEIKLADLIAKISEEIKEDELIAKGYKNLDGQFVVDKMATSVFINEADMTIEVYFTKNKLMKYTLEYYADEFIGDGWDTHLGSDDSGVGRVGEEIIFDIEDEDDFRILNAFREAHEATEVAYGRQSAFDRDRTEGFVLSETNDVFHIEYLALNWDGRISLYFIDKEDNEAYVGDYDAPLGIDLLTEFDYLAREYGSLFPTDSEYKGIDPKSGPLTGTKLIVIPVGPGEEPITKIYMKFAPATGARIPFPGFDIVEDDGVVEIVEEDNKIIIEDNYGDIVVDENNNEDVIVIEEGNEDGIVIEQGNEIEVEMGNDFEQNDVEESQEVFESNDADFVESVDVE